jgi:hypothetical protein
MYEIGMSPRAKRSAYVDGQPGAPYDALAVSAVRFTPDSRHSVYVVTGLETASGLVSFVVVDRTEGRRYDEVYAHTLDLLDASLVYAARSGRKFVHVAHPMQ